jgi:Carboxypeptidase regulatory-like domain/TonB-dependent Receptor Plug Domain
MRAACACALLAALAFPCAAEGQRVDGRVLDVASGSPIAGVDVILQRRDEVIATAVSDSAGRFTLNAPFFGSYHLAASHIGYAETRLPIELNVDGTFSVELTMGVEPVDVATIDVAVPRNRYLETRGFYERMEAGTGDYRTGDQLRSRNFLSLVDVLRSMRGVKIQRMNWKSEVYLTGANNCLPQIVVDGVTMRYGGRNVQGQGGGALTVDDLVNVSHIEGVEVYRGSGVPMEFEGPNASCGVIVVWTRVR